MLPDPLIDLAYAVGNMLDLVDGAGAFVPSRTRRIRLVGAWVLAIALGAAFWYWRTFLLAKFGAIFAVSVVAWVILVLALVLSTVAVFESPPRLRGPRTTRGAS